MKFKVGDYVRLNKACIMDGWEYDIIEHPYFPGEVFRILDIDFASKDWWKDDIFHVQNCNNMIQYNCHEDIDLFSLASPIELAKLRVKNV